MPDYSVTSRDPFQRAKAAADAQYGRWPGWVLTGSVGLFTSLFALFVVGRFATHANASMVISAAYLPVGLATLLAFRRERSRRKERTRLIDELWQTYAAEASRARAEPLRTPRSALRSLRSNLVGGT
jgi:hypothetical protein